jgi:hypothetical protein
VAFIDLYEQEFLEEPTEQEGNWFKELFESEGFTKIRKAHIASKTR